MRTLILLTLVALAVVAPSARAQTQPQTKPNIVFVMTDDQIAGTTQYMHNVTNTLAAEGTTFSNTYIAYPLCCPSRVTYLTGQYPHNHGVIRNAGPGGGYAGFDHSNSLPVWLQAAGYRTIHVGRHLNGYGVQNADRTEIPPGWDAWYSTLDPTTYDFANWQMNENGIIFDRPGLDHPGEYQTDYLGRRAAQLAGVASLSSQPFFLSLTFTAPHSGLPTDPDDPAALRTPSPAPRHRDTFAGVPLPRHADFNERDVSDKPRLVANNRKLTSTQVAAITENYRQELESLLSVDEAIGRLVDTLRATGELDNTLIIFTSDNGYFHGEHRIKSEKTLAYDPSTHVPMIVRGPGFPAGARLPQLVSNIDWAPTIVEAARATPGRLMDGRSLYHAGDEADRAIVQEDGNGASRIPRYRGLRTSRYLYVRWTRSREEELYDRRRDPYETRNLARSPRYRTVKERLHKRLRRLEQCAGAIACSR